MKRFCVFTPRSQIEEIFKLIDINGDGHINLEETKKIFLKINTKLNKGYGEDSVIGLFHLLDVNKDGVLSLEEFKDLYNKCF